MAPTDDDSGSSSSTAPLSGESNSSDAPPTSIDDSRVIQDVQAFREALQRSETPDRRTLIAKYPAIAKELSACLDGLEFVQGAAPRFQNGGPDSVRGTSPDETFPPHAQLGDYHIVREIGRGGMGVVYEAEQISLARRVALKVLPFVAVMDARQIGRFKNEALAAAQLDHPHIVNVHAVGCERGVHYYAMRFVDGRPLSAVIDEHRQSAGAPAEEVAADTAAMAGQSTHVSPDGPAYFRQVAEIGRQVADALDHAHRHGVVHRDVKPSNLLLDGEGRAWVADFGLARMGPDANLTMTGDLVGTLRYMSPEQLRGERAVIDHRTDIYSLGLTLYELLAQRPAFDGNDRQELLRQIATVDPPPPRRWNRAIPVELETIVLKATAKEAAERYGTAQELADDLQRYLEDRPILARRASLLNRTRKWARRHKAAVRTGLAFLLFAFSIVAGSIGWVVRDRAVQRAEASHEAAQMLNEALRLFERRDWPEAAAAARRAETMLAALDGDHAQRQQVQDLLAKLHQHDVDRKMVARLEEIRLLQADQPAARALSPFYGLRVYTLRGTDFDLRKTVQDYHEAFAAYGIDVKALSTEAATERIRSSDIHDQLVTALDDWIAVQHSRINNEKLVFDEQVERLLRILLMVDPDAWRSRLRTAAYQVTIFRGVIRREEAERADILELADQPAVASLPPSTVILLSRVLCQAADYSMAETVLQDAQQRYPEDFWLNYELGSLYLRRMTPPKPQEAVGYVRAALAIRPQSAGACVPLAESLIALGQYESPVPMLQKALALDPRCDRAYQLLGKCFEQQQEWNAALDAYTNAARLKPFVSAITMDRARCFSKAQRWNEAVTEWSKLAEKWTNDASIRVNLAEAYRNQQCFDKAVEQCRKAIQLKATADDAFFELGVALSQKGDWDEARRAFAAAAELQPRSFWYRCNVANCYRNLGQWEFAVSNYRQTIGLDPNIAEAHAELAWTLSRMHAWDEAVVEYREAVRLDPDAAGWHNTLAWLIATSPVRLQHNPNDAVLFAEKAVTLAADKSNYWNTLGVARYRAGQFAEAIRALNKSDELRPGSWQSACNAFFLSMSHFHLGESDDAACWYDLGVQLMDEQQDAIREEQLDKLERFRAEAAALLGLDIPPVNPDTKMNPSTSVPTND